jgi:hypothetical protein
MCIAAGAVESFLVTNPPANKPLQQPNAAMCR